MNKANAVKYVDESLKWFLDEWKGDRDWFVLELVADQLSTAVKYYNERHRKPRKARSKK